MEANERNWYALKVFYNKVFEMEDLLGGRGIECYLAVEKELLKGEAHLAAARKLAMTPEGGKPDGHFIREGALIYRRRPLVNSLLFVCASPQEILWVDAVLNEPNERGSSRGFIYKRSISPDKQVFEVIPPRQMEIFRLVTGAGLGGLEFFADDDITRYKRGGRVRVTEGPLKGAEGYIKRIRKDRRLLVAIEGVIAVATAYIPPQLLEPVPEE